MTGKRETRSPKNNKNNTATKRLPWHASKTRYATPEISAVYSSQNVHTHTHTHPHTHISTHSHSVYTLPI